MQTERQRRCGVDYRIGGSIVEGRSAGITEHRRLGPLARPRIEPLGRLGARKGHPCSSSRPPQVRLEPAGGREPRFLTCRILPHCLLSHTFFIGWAPGRERVASRDRDKRREGMVCRPIRCQLCGAHRGAASGARGFAAYLCDLHRFVAKRPAEEGQGRVDVSPNTSTPCAVSPYKKGLRAQTQSPL